MAWPADWLAGGSSPRAGKRPAAGWGGGGGGGGGGAPPGAPGRPASREGGGGSSQPSVRTAYTSCLGSMATPRGWYGPPSLQVARRQREGCGRSFRPRAAHHLRDGLRGLVLT